MRGLLCRCRTLILLTKSLLLIGWSRLRITDAPASALRKPTTTPNGHARYSRPACDYPLSDRRMSVPHILARLIPIVDRSNLQGRWPRKC